MKPAPKMDKTLKDVKLDAQVNTFGFRLNSDRQSLKSSKSSVAIVKTKNLDLQNLINSERGARKQDPTLASSRKSSFRVDKPIAAKNGKIDFAAMKTKSHYKVVEK